MDPSTKNSQSDKSPKKVNPSSEPFWDCEKIYKIQTFEEEKEQLSVWWEIEPAYYY